MFYRQRAAGTVIDKQYHLMPMFGQRLDAYLHRILDGVAASWETPFVRLDSFYDVQLLFFGQVRTWSQSRIPFALKR